MLIEKRSLAIIGVTILATLLYALFPREGIFQDFVAAAMFLCVMPLLFVRFLLRESVAQFGIRVGNYRLGLLWAILTTTGIVIAFLLLLSFTGIIKGYHIDFLQGNFTLYVLYVMLITAYAVVQTGFLQGFVGEGLRINNWSVGNILLLQSLWFIVVIGISAETIVSYLALVAATITTYYSNSLYYAFLMQFMVISITTGLVLHFLR